MQGYTLRLNPVTWDIEQDSSGNIALTTDAYAIAQNAANAVRLFKNDAYFEQEKGIPHFDVELGNTLPVSGAVLRSRIKKASLTVAGVRDAAVTLKYDEEDKKKERILGGQLHLTLTDGTTVQIRF